MSAVIDNEIVNARHPRSKLLLRAAIILAFLFGVGYVVGVLWQKDESELYGYYTPVFEPSPKLSDEYNESATWVLNKVARMQTPWTTEVATRLAEVLNNAYSEEYIEKVATRPGATIRDQEPAMLHGYVQGVVAERLRRNEPIEAEARKMLMVALLDSLRHPHWRIRHGAVQAVCYARLIEDRPVRLLVESMVTDPHPMVAANARKQLDHYDTYEALMAEQQR